MHDDVTSTPVITYKNQAWVVIPKEGDKGFILQNYHNPEETIEGNLKGGKEARAEAKQQAKQEEKLAHQQTREAYKNMYENREQIDTEWANKVTGTEIPETVKKTVSPVQRRAPS